MARLPLTLRLFLWVALSSPTITALPASRIIQRQNSCAVEPYETCGIGFPSNTCCPSGQECISLAGGTTVLCCPEGSTCDKIQAITCNIEAQDPEKWPEAPLKTTVFDVDLPKCGKDLCCPFGYGCTFKGECLKNRDQSNPPKVDKPTSTISSSSMSITSTTSRTLQSSITPSVLTTLTATAESTSMTFTTGTDAPAPTIVSDKAEKGVEDSGPDTTSIIGGVVGGCAILLVLAVMLFICIRRRAQRKPLSEKAGHARKKDGSGFSSIISDPIIQPGQYRADFILRPPSGSTNRDGGLSTLSGSGAHSTFRGPRISIPNPFLSPNPSPNPSITDRFSTTSNNDPLPLRGQATGARLAPIRAMKPSSRNLTPTVKSYLQHNQTSVESINIFADSETVDSRFQRQTRFTDLMEEADLCGVGRTKPYIQVPGTTPRI